MTSKKSDQKLFFDVLDKKRLKILPRLEFLRRDYGFYLAGGTALALQIGHRKSIDFDFYTAGDFDPKDLFRKFKTIFKNIASTHMAEGTLMAAIDDIEVSFFRYDYPLLNPLVELEYIDLSSLEDIAAMKVIAVVQRGTKRDFVDIFYLLKIFRLREMLEFTARKYSVFNEYIGLRALTYFEDAERDRSRRRLETFEKIRWDKIKKDIIDLVGKYTKERIPKR